MTLELLKESLQSLNNHCAAISTDSNYSEPSRKLTANNRGELYLTEWQVFNILDHLRPTATGLDGLPAWFIRLGAPVFYKPLTRLFNLSFTTSTVPQQWKHACICPVQKIAEPRDTQTFGQYLSLHS
jgi:hypothetical protein